MSGILYIVPTPLGNLEDMTPRAVKVLHEVSLILAEDTRTSAVLLNLLDIKTPVISHHKYNEHSTLNGLIDRLSTGESIALISDAGTPGISDPGFMLSRECRRQGIEVIALPGPTAFVPALVSSGLPCDRFMFEGFLPPKKGRASRLQWLSELPCTFIIYESPLRVQRTLLQLCEVCGQNREACVSREISKIHETHHKGTLQELYQYFSVNQPRGEIVIAVSGKPEEVREHKNKFKNPENTETDID